jgi:hypothetical protein
MRVLAVSVTVIAFLPGLPRAEAESRGAMDREAKKACLNGLPAKGVEILTDLYLETNDLTYIFNQGRCFEQNRRYEDAVGRFREYLLKGEHLSEDEKSLAQKHIAACQSFLGDRESSQTHPAGDNARPPPPPALSQPAVFAKAQDVQAEPAPMVELADRPPSVAATAQAGAGLRAAGIVTAAVGVAGLVAGLTLNLKVNSMASELSEVDRYNAGTESTRKDYATLGWIGYGVGATCVVAGVVLYYLGWRNGRGASTTTLVPTASPSMAGVAVARMF